jgi:protein-disulfide isomerase
MKRDGDIGLILAIVFASVVVSGSLVFFGMKMTGASASALDSDVISDAVDEGFERFVTRMEEEQNQQLAELDANASELAKNVPKVTNDDHIYGNKNAEISLIEYSDFVCPFCYRFHDTAKQLVDESGGEINWVYRHYALPSHDPVATNIAHASECIAEIAGNDKFWEFTDEVFARFSTPGRISTDESIDALAEEIGVDKSRFASCMESGKYKDKIIQERDDGSKSGVNGTPGNILINNKTGDAVSIKGAQPIDAFKDVLKEL